MSQVEVTLKSGATIHADVSEWTTRKNAATKEVTGFEWTHGGPRRLLWLKIDEVAAVVFVRDEGES